jgi:hypothetical protein
MATESKTRLENLKKACRMMGMVKSNSPEPSPTALGRAIDRNTNYCSDLLLGRRSFGEEIARHIEEKLGLSRWYLDGGGNSDMNASSRIQNVHGHGTALYSVEESPGALRSFFEAADAERLNKLTRAQRMRVVAAALEELDVIENFSPPPQGEEKVSEAPQPARPEAKSPAQKRPKKA